MSRISVWILGDQLLNPHPALAQAAAAVGRANVRVVLVESAFSRRRLPYHRQKIVLLLSAMRHYAAELTDQGYTVDYRHAADSLAGLRAHVRDHQPPQLLTMAASAWRGRQWQATLGDRLGVPVTVVPNSQFLVTQFDPHPDPDPDRRYVLEHFYRAMRRHFDVLMDGDEPAGGAWNFDADNRKPLPRNHPIPETPTFAPDAVTEAVMADVRADERLTGSAESFGWAVTRAQAQAAADRFLAERLADFGPYEDAMTQRSATLWHSVLSPYLNIGLLEPLPLIRAAEDAYRAGRVPINSAEGFVRQLLGWREFMYWQYWRQMPGIKQANAWGHTRPLPPFFWDGATPMACMQDVIGRTLATGYNHHIERLMLLGNYAFLAELDPAAVNDWFTALYVDATDWVMPPNVIGMSLNADGGLTATKPYFASANYINKMSDYCGGCPFDHKARHGDDACPFNVLYWRFVVQHEETLRQNPRTTRLTWSLRYLDAADRAAVRAQGDALLTGATADE